MSKYFSVLFFLCMFSLWSKPNWIEDLNYAKTLSEKQKKPILIDFYSESCYYCHVIEKETYNSKEFANWKNKFILTIVDGDKYPDLADEYQVSGYPTIVLLDSQGVEVGRIEGYYPKNQLLAKIEQYYKSTDLFHRLQENVKKEPLNYYHYFQLALYYHRAKQYHKTEEYFLKALQYLPENHPQYYENKKNLIYNLAVIHTKLKNYPKAYSYWNAYLAWLKKSDLDFPTAKYYRAYTLLFKNIDSNHTKTEQTLFSELSEKEKRIVIEDLTYASKNLPDSYEKEFSKKLLFELNH